MHFHFRNVNDAFENIIEWIDTKELETKKILYEGLYTHTVDEPVIITYSRPNERVLFNNARNCNPFYKLMKALWTLDTRNATVPPLYNESKTKYKTYMIGGGVDRNYCLREITVLLNELASEIPYLQSTLHIRIVEQDKSMKNGSVHYILAMFTINRRKTGAFMDEMGNSGPLYSNCLDMTLVTNSDDLKTDLFGEDHVTYTLLHEYLAGMSGLCVGLFHHITNRLYVLESELLEIKDWTKEYKHRNMHSPPIIRYGTGKETIYVVPLVTDPTTFDNELPIFLDRFDIPKLPRDDENRERILQYEFKEPFFRDVAVPMLSAFILFKNEKSTQECIDVLQLVQSKDWRIAGERWITKAAQTQ